MSASIAATPTMPLSSRVLTPLELEDYCRRHGVRKLSLFGSILREDFGPESDVDVLVEFEPHRPVGFRIIDMERELSSLYGGRPVQIVSEKYLNPRLRPRILASAQVQFERTG